MQRLEAVVILMKEIFSDIEFVFPKKADFENFAKKFPLEPFSIETINFLDEFSKKLLDDQQTKDYPDLITLSFFCRRANIIQLKNKHCNSNELRLGVGLLFHISPSNVAVNFAYSLISGLLSGNFNIIRLPSILFDQVEIICKVIKKINKDPKHFYITSRIILVRYQRTSNATKYLSSICDARIIWGGNETINQIRENKIRSRSFDLTFADRYSLCVINADKYLKDNISKKIAKSFYNDTYLFDQNACTSPHLIIWLGDKDKVIKSRDIFWKSLHEILKHEYKVQPIIAVNKLATLFSQSIDINNIKNIKTEDNLIFRVELEKLPKKIHKYRCSSGYFNEYHADNILEIKKIVNKSYQTLSYYGLEKKELKNFINESKIKGIDRIVPIGRTSEFSLIWDGYDLIRKLSRLCEII